MSKARSARPQKNPSYFASQEYHNYMLGIDGQPSASGNQQYISPSVHSGQTPIQRNFQDGVIRNDKILKSHRKKTQVDPDSSMVVHEIEQHKGFSLQMPGGSRKIKPEPRNQTESTANNSNYQQAISPIKPIFEIDLGSFEVDPPETAAKGNKVGNKTQTSQNYISSKLKGNRNASEEKKNLTHGRTVSKDPIVPHDSSNMLFQDGSLTTKIPRASLIQPIPQGENRQFSYKREQLFCSSMSNPQYSLHLNGGGFLLNAKKQFGHINSTYLISATENKYEQKDGAYLGYIKGNFTGSEFNVFQAKDDSHQVVATIAYESGFKFSSNFRKIEVYLKNPAFRGSFGDNASLKELYSSVGDNNSRNIIKLVTKEPKYQPKQDCYILNFKGKSRFGSIKNMILIEPSKPNDYILMFCKNDSHEFHLEAVYPLSPLIAFGIVLSGFDFKLCCQ